jgi:hypothetical protein
VAAHSAEVVAHSAMVEVVEPPGHPTLSLVARAVAMVVVVPVMLRAAPLWPRARPCHPPLARRGRLYSALSGANDRLRLSSLQSYAYMGSAHLCGANTYISLFHDSRTRYCFTSTPG